MLAIVGNLGPAETVLIVVVAVLVFGGRLPEVARDAMRAFYKMRRSLDEIRHDMGGVGRELDDLRRDVTRTVEAPKPRGVRPPKREPEPDPDAPALDPGAASSEKEDS